MNISKNSGGEAGKSTPMRQFALSGRDSYLLCYKIAAPLLVLNLFLLGLQWITAMIMLPGTRQYFMNAATAILIFLVVFVLWIKTSIEYYWEMARELSEKNRLETSFKVQFYRVAVGCYWQTFVGYAKLWSGLALISALSSVASGCMILYLIVLWPSNEIVGIVQLTWMTMLWSVIIQLTYCLLTHRTINVLTEEDGGIKR